MDNNDKEKWQEEEVYLDGKPRGRSRIRRVLECTESGSRQDVNDMSTLLSAIRERDGDELESLVSCIF